MRKEHRFSDGWVWPREIREWVRKKTHGRTVNICSGQSRIGDVLVDIAPEVNPHVRADMENLPFPNGVFDSSVSDPPWNMDWYERRQPFYEAVRIVRPGGTIVYNCPWRPKSDWVRLVDSKRRVDAEWGEVSIVWVFERHKHNSASEVEW